MGISRCPAGLTHLPSSLSGNVLDSRRVSTYPFHLPQQLQTPLPWGRWVGQPWSVRPVPHCLHCCSEPTRNLGIHPKPSLQACVGKRILAFSCLTVTTHDFSATGSYTPLPASFLCLYPFPSTSSSPLVRS